MGTPNPLPLEDLRIDDPFWSPRLETNRRVTLPWIHQHLVETGRLAAFDLKWRPGRPGKPHLFWDSDVAKWVEGASRALRSGPDPELERLVNRAAGRIARAQQPDGYLNTYFTQVAPGKRWTNLRDNHELYCAGHLIEAGIEHLAATGQTVLFDAARRYADLLVKTFGKGRGKIPGYPGHQEIELALVKLYRATNHAPYLELARFFLLERGRQPHFFDWEARQRGEDPRSWRYKTYEYCQAHVPPLEQGEAVGHAVRALYMYSAMADLALETGEARWARACRRIWENIVFRKLFITGGVGASAANEGFSFDYDLPEEGAYAETCAAAAFLLFNRRMFRLDRESRFMDVLEQTLYNGFLSGISLSGDRFFYSNPLASHDPAAGKRGKGKDTEELVWDGITRHRKGWFGCACCPPNLARVLAGLGEFALSLEGRRIWLHLFLSATFRLQVGRVPLELKVKTDYPLGGKVEISLHPEKPLEAVLLLRIPSWCRKAWVLAGGPRRDALEGRRKGYFPLAGPWKEGDRVELHLSMPPEKVRAHPLVRQAAGKVALRRGPLVYCLESCDNPGAPLESLVLPAGAALEVSARPHLPGKARSLRFPAALEKPGQAKSPLYSQVPPERVPYQAAAVPYYIWDNRRPGSMRVWIREGP